MLDPSAMYAMSNERSVISGTFDDDFHVIQRSAECDMWFAHGGACRSNSRAVGQRTARHAIPDLFQKVDWARAHDVCGDCLELAIVDHAFAVGDANVKIDLDWLRRRPLVRKNSHERVKAHTAESNLDHR